jgi:Mini-chromosome maintenance replisome factor
MIQDMLETEYFSVNDATIPPTRPNASSSLHPFEQNVTPKLSERTPYMVVAIQPSTAIVTDSSPGVSNNPSPACHNNDRCENAKRVRYDTNPSPRMEDPTATQPFFNKESVAAVVPEVVAKFYLDQYPIDQNGTIDQTATLTSGSGSNHRSKSSPLQLNQMVEILGVLEDDQFLCMHEENENLMDDTAGPRPPPFSNHHGNQLDVEDRMEYVTSSATLLEENEATILPLHIPRLHVLWYRIVSIDDDDDVEETGVSNAHRLPATPANAKELHQAWMKVVATKDECNIGENHNAWKIASEAIWMLLHSKAERDSVTGLVKATPHNESILGCASLNIVLPVSATTSTTVTTTEDPYCCDMAGFLVYTLQRLVPHCHQLILSNYDVSSTPLTAIQAPHKLFGRLRSTSLQLPAGSVLIVDIRKWQENTKCHTYNHDDVNHLLHSIRQICRHHMLSYKFEGGVQIPFEADYRVLVLSNSVTQHFIPSTLTMQLPSSAFCFSLPNNWSSQLDPLLLPIRSCIQHNRCTVHNSSIHLDQSVIDRAQQDFCHRRSRSRNSGTTTMTTENRHVKEVDEVDFHRWLTLCRIHARSRGTNVAEIIDWEYAIQLDDAMLMKTTLS